MAQVVRQDEDAIDGPFAAGQPALQHHRSHPRPTLGASRAAHRVAPLIVRPTRPLGDELERILLSLPRTGPLFPKLQPMREAHRATEFRRACRRLKISGIIGWHPNLNDGMHLNIRPFVEAEVLRKRPNATGEIERIQNR